MLLLSICTVSPLPLYAENPWHDDSRVIIDNDLANKPEKNMWSEQKKLDNAVDPNLYPPLDEDLTLGITMPAYPGVEQKNTQPSTTVPEYQYPSEQPQQNQYSGNPDYPYGGYRGGYAGRPYAGYQNRPFGSAWPGSNFWGGAPFGGDSWGGAPYGGNSWGSMPFGMGDSWMPFGGPGFW
jgi:hypothetical protein